MSLNKHQPPTKSKLNKLLKRPEEELCRCAHPNPKMISKSGHLIPEAFIDRRGYTSVAQRANRDSADVVKELHKQFKGPLCRGPVFSFTKEQCQQYRDPDHDEEVGIPVKPDRGSNIYHCKVIGSEDKGILSTKQARYLSKCAKYLGE